MNDSLKTNVQHVDGYLVGLEAADVLKRLFPDFHRAHIAERRVTPAAMLGVAQAFLSLANQLIELDLTVDLTIDSDDPSSVLDVHDDDEGALDALEHSARAFIAEVWPLVYGIEHEVDVLFDHGPHNVLALALWCMAERTPWNVWDDITDIRDYVLRHNLPPDAPLAAILAGVRHIPAGVRMDQLCAVLDHHNDDYGCNLGAIMRYVFSATGNPFADLSWTEVAEMESSGLAWDGPLEEWARDQQQAQEWQRHYAALDQRIVDDPPILDQLVHHVLQAANVLAAAAPQAPGLEESGAYE